MTHRAEPVYEKRQVPGNFILLGLGSVGASVLAVARRHFDVQGRRIALSEQAQQAALAACHGHEHMAATITPSNYQALLTPLLTPGSLLINLCVEVSSIDLILLCRAHGCLYIDTVTDPWPGVYAAGDRTPWERSNAYLRQQLLHRAKGTEPTPTAICTHGANPGWVSHLVKQALLELARSDAHHPAAHNADPIHRADWAQLASDLGVRTIQIAERDWQRTIRPVPDNVLANTWSVDGLVAEAFGQCGEIGWGSHERAVPQGAQVHEGVLLMPDTGRPHEVRSWTPLSGSHQALIVTHAEAISIADFLTLPGEAGYRPTVYYAYRPIDSAWQARLWPRGCALALGASHKRVLNGADLDDGIDELGVLLLGERFGSCWIGSRLSASLADQIIPGASATSVQVVAGVIAAAIMALDAPMRGLLEPEDLDHAKALQLCAPYLGPMVTVRSDWHPTEQTRGFQFSDFLAPETAPQARDLSPS